MLVALDPDATLFVGDLSDGDLKLVKAIASIELPTAVILGNHDRGKDLSGFQLKAQLSLLGEKDCSWSYWYHPSISIVGARPCSPGGGYYLYSQVSALYGQLSFDESVNRIVNAARQAPKELPLIVLAHSGPTGLGSDSTSPCGRDWKKPYIDWGDKDLEIAIDEIRKFRKLELVVFGHMHHKLKQGKGNRKTFIFDHIRNTAFLNAASVPRKINDLDGQMLTHLTWVEFLDNELIHASHRWFRLDYSLAYEERLFNL